MPVCELTWTLVSCAKDGPIFKLDPVVLPVRIVGQAHGRVGVEELAVEQSAIVASGLFAAELLNKKHNILVRIISLVPC